MTQSFESRLYDGKQLTPTTVTVTCTSAGFSIQGENIDWRWSYSGTRVVSVPTKTTAGQLKHVEWPEARLVIADDALYQQWIAPHIPTKHHRTGLFHLSWRMIAVLAVGVIIAMALAVLSIPFISHHLAKIVPPAWEQTLGQQVIHYQFSNTPVCVHPEGHAALTQLISRLQGEAIAPPYRVMVVDDDATVNAVALPGGYIIVMSGLLKAAPSADALAGVLTHEMGHVALRHNTELIIRQLGMQLLFASLSGNLIDLTGHMLQLKYARDFERAADQFATQRLNDANISPYGFAMMMDYFASLENESGLTSPDYFHTHPATNGRKEDALTTINQAQTYTPSLTAPQWDALKSICQEKQSIKKESF